MPSMRIERHSHAAHHQEESSPFTFLPTAILTFGALPFLAQNASAADERPETTPAEEAFIRAGSAVGAAFVKLAAVYYTNLTLPQKKEGGSRVVWRDL